MPICFERKIVFVHVPKTGGTSINSYFNFKEKLKNFYGVVNQSLELSHFSLDEIAEHLNLNSFFKFSFVRNPWDRLVSKYFFYKIGYRKKNEKSLSIFDNVESFDDYVFEIFKNFKNIQNNYPSHYLCNHFKTQSSFVISKNYKLDFLGNFENFNFDLKKIGSIFNIKKDIPCLNFTNHKNYQFYYNKKTKKIVEELYGEDIKNFNYKFDKKTYFI